MNNLTRLSIAEPEMMLDLVCCDKACTECQAHAWCNREDARCDREWLLAEASMPASCQKDGRLKGDTRQAVIVDELEEIVSRPLIEATSAHND